MEGGGIRCKHCGLVCADGKEAKRHRAYFHYRTKKCPHCDFLGHADKVGWVCQRSEIDLNIEKYDKNLSYKTTNSL